MAKKADNIFVRAKKYRAEHPRTSFQDAIKKVSGVKRKSVSKAKPRKVAAVTGSTRKRVVAKRVTEPTVKSELLKTYFLIDKYEMMLSSTRSKKERSLIVSRINSYHDKIDQLKSRVFTNFKLYSHA